MGQMKRRWMELGLDQLEAIAEREEQIMKEPWVDVRRRFIESQKRKIVEEIVRDYYGADLSPTHKHVEPEDTRDVDKSLKAQRDKLLREVFS